MNIFYIRKSIMTDYTSNDKKMFCYYSSNDKGMIENNNIPGLAKIL